MKWQWRMKSGDAKNTRSKKERRVNITKWVFGDPNEPDKSRAYIILGYVIGVPLLLAAIGGIAWLLRWALDLVW